MSEDTSLLYKTLKLGTSTYTSTKFRGIKRQHNDNNHESFIQHLRGNLILRLWTNPTVKFVYYFAWDLLDIFVLGRRRVLLSYFGSVLSGWCLLKWTPSLRSRVLFLPLEPVAFYEVSRRDLSRAPFSPDYRLVPPVPL